MTDKILKRGTSLLLIAFLSISALLFGELLEQVVFVPNWLIGDVDQNLEHFRKFKHTTDPGMFYFPLTLVAIVSHLLLLKKNSLLSGLQKKAVRLSLILFLIVFVLTIYVIVCINVPVIDNGELSGEALRSKIWLWAVLNMFRIILPACGVYKLGQLLILKREA
ncbi:hypothetical protein [Sediminicola luteus]|uniref:DUF1772 domain-containing protein n=1 Tax=Sediminicola luteus TaxID=319238 RepID=A0A2A4G7E8_9FLAO|nr:hypothetical protein [Sediminicola luteus]PCE64557.1 hypothetical protein B7P33_09755 [Sediminicola luteus]